MRPLDPLPAIERLLHQAAPDEVRSALAELDGELDASARAAKTFAEGALALRIGSLDEACTHLDAAAQAFLAMGEREGAALARAEAWLAAIRRGPRKIYWDAIEGLEALEAEAGATRRVRVVAAHYRGTALRYAGRAEETLRTLLGAFASSDGLLAERAQVLNSLGTLYVVLGAYGAAQAVLEHGAELSGRIGDKVSEAISYGQLGSAALARGALDEARRHLQRQEWLASRVGDAFGQSRALVLLADLALDAGRPDDALELASAARRLASSVSPPLGMWLAYAARTIGRAQLELDDRNGLGELVDAQARFRQIGNQLGEALVGWDLARAGSRDAPRWERTAWALATLGLTQRVARVVADARDRTSDPEERRALELVVAAAAQCDAHLSSAQEVDLVLTQPDVVASIATRRIGGQRNLGRLAALALAPAGLYVAAAAGARAGTSAMPSARSAAALIVEVPGIVLWAWPAETEPAILARDLSSFRAALGDELRACLSFSATAKVNGLPFAGEQSVAIRDLDLGPLCAHALADPPGTLRRLGDMPWPVEAEALARMSGFISQ